MNVWSTADLLFSRYVPGLVPLLSHACELKAHLLELCSPIVLPELPYVQGRIGYLYVTGGNGNDDTRCECKSFQRVTLLPVVCRCHMLPTTVHHGTAGGTATCIVQARGLVTQPLQYTPFPFSWNKQQNQNICGSQHTFGSLRHPCEGSKR